MKKRQIEILRYYLYNAEGKIKYFESDRKLIDEYVNYVEENGYVAFGIEYKRDSQELIESTDLVKRVEKYDEWEEKDIITWEYTDDKDKLVESVGGKYCLEGDKIDYMALNMCSRAKADERAKRDGRVFVMRYNGYAFTKSQIMYAHNLDEKEYDEFMKKYEESEHKGSIASLIDRKLEHYSYYSDTPIL